MKKLIVNGKEIGIDFDAMIKAKDEGKESFEINTDFFIYDKESRDAWFNNTKGESIKTALELEAKKWKKEFELEGKDFKELFENFANKLKSESNLTVDEKVKKYQEDTNLLKSTIDALKNEKQLAVNELETFKQNILLEKEVIGNIPDNIVLPKEDMALILRNRLSPTVLDGRVVYKENGKELKDGHTADYLDSKTVIANFFKQNQNYLKVPAGGAGGKDSTADTNDKSVKSFIEKRKANGESTTGLEFSKALNEAVKSGEVVA